MFKWFIKKFKKTIDETKDTMEKIENIDIPKPKEIVWVLQIDYNNITRNSQIFKNSGVGYPISYRKFLNWFLFRDGEVYNFIYNNGNKTFNRKDIFKIQVDKIEE